MPPAGRRRLARACRSWQATVEGELPGRVSSVIAVRLPDGSRAVAKLERRWWSHSHEARALAAWDGAGAVRLLDRRPGVLLIERAEPGEPAGSDDDVAHCLARLWMDPPAGVAWSRADDLVGRWRDQVSRARPALGDRLVDAALEVLADGFGDGPRVLLHGDGHHGNVLDGGPGRGFLAIDPLPLVGPPELDLAKALYNGPDGPVGERIARLAGESGTDAEALRRLAVPRLAVTAAWVVASGWPLSRARRALAVAAELCP